MFNTDLSFDPTGDSGNLFLDMFWRGIEQSIPEDGDYFDGDIRYAVVNRDPRHLHTFAGQRDASPCRTPPAKSSPHPARCLPGEGDAPGATWPWLGTTARPAVTMARTGLKVPLKAVFSSWI